MILSFKSNRPGSGKQPTPFGCIVNALVVFLFFCVGPASAASDEAADNLLLINSRESCDIDLVALSWEFNGNVNITLGKTEITADKVIMYFKKNMDAGLPLSAEALEKSIASGNVQIISEEGTATAHEAAYDAEAQTLVLTGEPATIVSNELNMSCPVIRVNGVAL